MRIPYCVKALSFYVLRNTKYVLMPLNAYEKEARREIDDWLRGDASLAMQALDLAARPLDWATERAVPDDARDRATDRITDFLSTLNDATEWTHEDEDLLARAREHDLRLASIEALRKEPLADLDPLARSFFTENAVLAAIEGGGTGMGGAVLMAADIPMLFTINLRLIQQIAASYGFPLRRPAYRFLVLNIFNAAAAGTKDAKNEAMREISVAASSLASDGEYQSRAPSGTFRDQSRNLPREIAKNIVGRKLAQTVPVAGAAVGAGVNYWFTAETGQTAYMLARALHLEHKERRG
jgi:uncharacterized protein (DUF697 family)